jgi:hypothetical protein
VKLIAVLLVVGLSGCAAMQQERADRFMPRPTLPADTGSIFSGECGVARDAAIADKTNPPTLTIQRMVDVCSASSAMNCNSWMRKDVLLAHGIVMDDATLSAVDAASTIAAGAFKFSPGAVAALGGIQMVGHLFGQVQQAGLGIPDTFVAQQKMRTALGQCSKTLITQSKAAMSLTEAINGIGVCDWVCTPGAATTVATAALAQSDVVVQPSGELTITTTSSFQKDDSSQRIIAFWMPGGAVNAANDAKLKKWMADNSISVSVPFLAHAKVYESARKQAVTDLGIP